MSPLSRAIALWKAGKAISLDLFATLASDGFDVPALESRYRT